MSTHATTVHSAGSHPHVHGGPRIYAAVLAALLALTVITVAASYVNFGSTSVNVVVAMTIATCKASLVALFFMHLRWDKPMNAVIFVSSLFFLGVLLLFVFIDHGSRPDISPASRKPPAGGRPAPAAPAVPASSAAPAVH